MSPQARQAPRACHLCPPARTAVRRNKAPRSVFNLGPKRFRCQSTEPKPRRHASQQKAQAGKDPETPGDDIRQTGSSKNTSAGDEEDVETALRALKWYKSTISPILPRSCRFLPTCSEYSMQAYKEFGNVRGTILTAWRLMRCNPLNWKVEYQGKYDPPKWPPIGFEWLVKQ